MSKKPNESEHKREVGQRIKKIRDQKKWSMKKLAELADIKGGTSTIWRYEHGEMHPRSHLAALAAALEVSIDYLENGTLYTSSSLPITSQEVYAEAVPHLKQITPKPEFNFFCMIGELHILHGFNLSDDEKETLLRKRVSLGRVELEFLADYIRTIRETGIKNKSEKRQKLSLSSYRTRKNR